MGLFYTLHPFDSDKFYREIVPSLKKGLTDRPDLFEGYKRTCINEKTELTPDLIASIASQFDTEFKSYPGYNAYSTDVFTFRDERDWIEEWSSLFQFIIFQECAFYEPEFTFGKSGIALMYDNTPANSVAKDIFTTIERATIFSCYSIGIVNWIKNEDVKLLLLDAKSIRLANRYKEEFPDLYDYNFDRFLTLVDRHSLGLVYGVDLLDYRVPGRTLS
ncbi:hypothetical protein QNI16_02425 [Cytophagaceae bacterium YF14B1]|uniref:Uncharacterized protein n=1 Tax=Xanthocytophaga flava TaxID=3048013 RepID=A0AAE3QH73_9BACT|nr:hypothetical protein [Xanthocytophaga flavus]MDJ1479322.1 hypothetical protein [Xanthocytophaga flavus]